MDVRSQVAMVLHLDKCIGCHTCSVACKSVWTDRPGAETMWWNNVETRPGAGYPRRWEDQVRFRGGFERTPDGIRVRAVGKLRGALTVFHNPTLPTIDDYYDPRRFDGGALLDAAEGSEPPVARPFSSLTGEPTDIASGPAWDDELAGSTEHAIDDPNLDAASPAERAAMFELERLISFNLPRVCNHCANPSCVTACPSGAMYKRGEDGIVLLNQEACRAWRFCVTACPYKKVYFNWQSGKGEKCHLCYPHLEAGTAPACFSSCVGRIRYLGVLLYDGDRIESSVNVPDGQLVDAQRELLLDPNDPDVIAGARDNGIPEDVLAAARRSPIWKWVAEWGLALPLHAEYRTLPMLFYVPPLMPVMGTLGLGHEDATLADLDRYRLPMSYLASLLAAGNEGPVRYALRKQLAVRLHRRAATAGDVDAERVRAALAEADCSPEQAEAIHRLTTLAGQEDRFVIPPMHRAQAISLHQDPLEARGAAGVGFLSRPDRGA